MILAEAGAELSARGSVLVRVLKALVPDEKFWLRLKALLLYDVARHRCGWEGCPFCGGRG